MSEAPNPYATPGSNLVQEGEDGAGGIPKGAEFDFGTSLTEAWEALKNYFFLHFGAGLLLSIIAFVSIFTIVGAFLVVPVLGWGYTKFLLNMQDGTAEFGDVFSGFSNYGKALGRFILLGIMVFALQVIGNSVSYYGQFQGDFGLQLLGSLVNFAFLLTVVCRFYFAPFIIVEHDMGAFEAMMMSWEATSHQKLRVMGLTAFVMPLTFAGLLALFVGIIPASMLWYQMWPAAYRQMSPRPS